MRTVVGILLLLAFPVGAQVQVNVEPKRPLIELGDHRQLANFDFHIRNVGTETVTLAEIELSVTDGHGKLELRRLLNGNGISPSIETIPRREIPGASEVLIFNPFFDFPRNIDLASLTYKFTFSSKAGTAAGIMVVASARPLAYRNKTHLKLPLRGRLLVWDGHDFYSHHRRWDYTLPIVKEVGIDSNSNSGRYSYDFVIVDEFGAMLQGLPERNESWLGFGKPVYATARGKVVACEDSHPDDGHMVMAELKNNPLAEFGNYVVVDHGMGELSVFGHIKQGSAKVKIGEFVKSGQEIAAIGASGSSLFPHLHYQLQDSLGRQAEGVPSYFQGFTRVLGSRKVTSTEGQVDTGELLEQY